MRFILLLFFVSSKVYCQDKHNSKCTIIHTYEDLYDTKNYNRLTNINFQILFHGIYIIEYKNVRKKIVINSMLDRWGNDSIITPIKVKIGSKPLLFNLYDCKNRVNYRTCLMPGYLNIFVYRDTTKKYNLLEYRYFNHPLELE
jgi:hypothetical protein